MKSSSPSESTQISFFDITDQLDPKHPLLALAKAIPWSDLEDSFSNLYSDVGRKAKPIRLMTGLLMLKQLYDISDASVVLQWRMNPYY